MDTELDAALRALARRQHSLVSKEQARGLGATKFDLRRRLSSPDWELLGNHVLRLVGSRSTFEQHCMAAVLDAGGDSFIACESAAALWRLPGFEPATIIVNRRRGAARRPTSLAKVRHPRTLPQRHVTAMDGVPVTTVARTLFDLAGTSHRARVERAVDNALSRRLTSVGRLKRVTVDLAERGRKGSTLMRQLLAARGARYVPPDSGLEAQLMAILARGGLESPERQVDLGGAEWIGRVDFFYRKHRLVIEVDSDVHHSSLLDRVADARRDRALRAAGFRVLRSTEHDIRNRPDDVVACIRAALHCAA